MTSVSFFVPGQVSAQGSKRAIRRGSKTVLLDMNANLQPWRDSICWAARQAAQEQLNWRDVHGPVFDGPVHVILRALYGRPKVHYGTGRNAAKVKDAAPIWKTSAPDIDKASRAALDALTSSGIWRDDAQVSRLLAEKAYALADETPGLEVQVWDL